MNDSNPIITYWNPETQQLEMTPSPPTESDWAEVRAQIAAYGMTVVPIAALKEVIEPLEFNITEGLEWLTESEEQALRVLQDCLSQPEAS